MWFWPEHCFFILLALYRCLESVEHLPPLWFVSFVASCFYVEQIERKAPAAQNKSHPGKINFYLLSTPLEAINSVFKAKGTPCESSALLGDALKSQLLSWRCGPTLAQHVFLVVGYWSSLVLRSFRTLRRGHFWMEVAFFPFFHFCLAKTIF